MSCCGGDACRRQTRHAEAIAHTESRGSVTIQQHMPITSGSWKPSSAIASSSLPRQARLNTGTRRSMGTTAAAACAEVAAAAAAVGRPGPRRVPPAACIQ